MICNPIKVGNTDSRVLVRRDAASRTLALVGCLVMAWSSCAIAQASEPIPHAPSDHEAAPPTTIGGVCSPSNPQSCYECGTEPGCNDVECCQHICDNVDPLCCALEWDCACAAAALDECGLPNDQCAGALTLPLGTTTFNTLSASTDGPANASCACGSQIDKDIWFRHTASCDGSLTISLCGSTFNTKLAVYQGFACPPGAPLACNDNACGTGGSRSQLTQAVTAGQQLLIRVGGCNSASGGGSINLDLVCGCDNDDCADACPIGDETVEFNTSNASTDGPPNALCSAQGDNNIAKDVWFNYLASCTGTLLLETCGSAFNTTLALYQGTGCVGAILGCNDGYQYCDSFLHAALHVNVTQGQFYKVRVGGQKMDAGSGTLRVQCGCDVDADCQDVLFCNGNERCDTGFCLPGFSPCASFEVCSEEFQLCEPRACSSNAECIDGLFCNGLESCEEGFCQGGTSPCAPCGCNDQTDQCTCPCPAGGFTFMSPPNGAVDARQPHPVDSTSPAQGIQTIMATGPAGAAGPNCWSLCESVSLGDPNLIADVDETAGLYTISLARPITPRAVTRVTYTPSNGVPSSGRFIFHPANVNADALASPLDILRIIDCLNGVSPGANCPLGILSCDADRSNACNPADILRVIDLLNGAGAFEVANGTILPSGCP